MSSLNPWGTAATLLVVLSVTLLKDGLEDRERHVADHRENSGLITVLGKDGEYEHISRESLRVGEIVLVHNKAQFPADIIVVACEDLDGQCYVETANIDGETNLKVRKVPQQLVDLGLNSQNKVVRQGIVECDYPNKDIHNFNGALQVQGQSVPLGAQHFLLRGSVLRNTGWILGLVVYTGTDTKIMKNRGKAVPKLSNIEHTVNRLITMVLLAQFGMVMTSVMVNVVYTNTYGEPYYLGGWNSIFPYWLANTFTFYTLYSNFVPISLYVTVELVNLAQGWVINNDIDMYDHVNDIPAVCRNSSLCQEIGQVEYVFSDKTGTLTQNVMEFKKACVNGHQYTLSSATSAAKSNDIAVREFFRLLAVCHTVVPDSESLPDAQGIPAYEAESPDEGALVYSAAKVGMIFTTRTPDCVYLKEFGKRVEYRILAVNEFNSTRKRMSCIVQNETGKYILYCKGADNVMLERTKMTKRELVETNALLSEFAEAGLRTLVCSRRSLSSEQAGLWLTRYRQAQLCVEGRGIKLAEVAEDIEVDMTFVGASAIEDKLQDNVPETIEDLRKAGIKVWVLTGDKLETAVNIGYSCRLLDHSMRVITIASDDTRVIREELLRMDAVLKVSGNRSLFANFKRKLRGVFTTSKNASMALKVIKEEKEMEKQQANMKRVNIKRSMSDMEQGNMNVVEMTNLTPSSSMDYEKTVYDSLKSTDRLALVIDGRAVSAIMESPELSQALISIGQMCKSVIACRVSPAQKAEIVSLIKDGVASSPITLSIGDGANDVTMIQRAHVGIGISGKEGRQAVNSSDFSIGQFQFLKKLLLVHGRWNYRRQSKVICMMLYKNIVLCCALFIYNFWTRMSSTTIFDTWVYSGYNFYTGMPPLLMGALDQDISAVVLMAVPALYISGRESHYLNGHQLFHWVARSVYQSLLCGLLPIILGLYFNIQNDIMGILSFGSIVFASILLSTHVTMALENMTWTWLHAFFYPGGILLYIVSILVLQEITVTYAGIALLVLESTSYWVVGWILVPLSVYIIEAAFHILRRQYFQNIVDLGTMVSFSKGIDINQLKQLCEAEFYNEKVLDGALEEVIHETYSEDEDMRNKNLARRSSNANLE